MYFLSPFLLYTPHFLYPASHIPLTHHLPFNTHKYSFITKRIHPIYFLGLWNCAPHCIKKKEFLSPHPTNFTEPRFFNPRSSSKFFNHITWQMVHAIALYSTSAVLLPTTLCLFYFHERGASPSMIQEPDVDILVFWQPTQSLSQ